MREFKYRSIHIVYDDGSIENFFGVAGAITTYSMLAGDTAVAFYANDGGGWQPHIERYLKPEDRLEISTHTVTVE